MPLATEDSPPAEITNQFLSDPPGKLSTIEAAEEWVSVALARAAALRQSILARAFRGELVPRDPTDEPAGVLLERIQKEREGVVAVLRAPRRRKAAGKT